MSGGDGVHHPVPNTCLPPSHEAVVAGGSRAIPFREVTPRRTGSQNPEDAVQHAAIVDAGHASEFVGQKRLDHAPFEVGQIISAHADAESNSCANGKLLTKVAAIACSDCMLHRRPMKCVCSLPVIACAAVASACSPTAPSTECKGLSPSHAVALAVEQKRGMLGRSVQSERDNFADDVAHVAQDSTGYVAKVGFKGKDGRTLVALIDEDCYVGWTSAAPTR